MEGQGENPSKSVAAAKVELNISERNFAAELERTAEQKTVLEQKLVADHKLAEQQQEHSTEKKLAQLQTQLERQTLVTEFEEAQRSAQANHRAQLEESTAAADEHKARTIEVEQRWVAQYEQQVEALVVMQGEAVEARAEVHVAAQQSAAESKLLGDRLFEMQQRLEEQEAQAKRAAAAAAAAELMAEEVAQAAAQAAQREIAEQVRDVAAEMVAAEAAQATRLQAAEREARLVNAEQAASVMYAGRVALWRNRLFRSWRSLILDSHRRIDFARRILLHRRTSLQKKAFRRWERRLHTHHIAGPRGRYVTRPNGKPRELRPTSHWAPVKNQFIAAQRFSKVPSKVSIAQDERRGPKFTSAVSVLDLAKTSGHQK